MAVGAVALEALHPGLSVGYAHDILRAGAANGILFRRFYVVQAILANAQAGVLLASLAAVAAWTAPGQRLASAGMLVVAGGAVLVSTQNYGATSPALIVLVLLLAQRVRGIGAGASASPALATAGAFATLLAVAPFVATQATGAAFQVAMARSTGFIADGGRTAPLRDVVWYRALFEPSFMPEEFTAADALKWQHLLPPETVSVILGDAEVVMQPKLWWYYFVVQNLADETADLLHQDFTPHESRYWTAWVRR